MKPRDQASTLTKSSKRNAAYKLFSVIIIAGFLAIATGEILRAQNPPAPAPAPTPEAAPKQVEPPEAPEAPEPPEPAEPPEADQLFVFNDGAVHLGVDLSDVSTEKAQELKLPFIEGAIVTDVEKGSPADEAGILKGDVILEFDGIRVRSNAELRRLIRETPTGRSVAIQVDRNGKTLNLTAQLKASSEFSYSMPELKIPSMRFDDMPRVHVPPMVFDGPPPAIIKRQAILGIAGNNLTPQLADYFGVKQGKGLLVSEVTKDGPGDKAGLKAGDVITQVDGKPVGGVEELRAALNEKIEGDTAKVSLTIVRDRHEVKLQAELTRDHLWKKYPSSVITPDGPQPADKAKLKLDQQRILADERRQQSDLQRVQLQSQVMKQKQILNREWQIEFQRQMLMLKDLQQKKGLHVQSDDGGEI